jgi:hypothetical protein
MLHRLQVIVRLEGLGQSKNPMALSGIEPANFRLVALCLNHATALPLDITRESPARNSEGNSRNACGNEGREQQNVEIEIVTVRAVSWDVYDR